MKPHNKVRSTGRAKALKRLSRYAEQDTAQDLKQPVQAGRLVRRPAKTRKYVGQVNGEAARHHAGKKPRSGSRSRFADGGAANDIGPTLADVLVHPLDQQTEDLGSAAGRLGGAVANAAVHPVQTLRAFGDLAHGLASQAENALGLTQSPLGRTGSGPRARR